MEYTHSDVHFMEIDESCHETLHYNFPDFPIYSNQEYLSSYPNKKALCHWHTDYEMIYILDGEMNFFINGTVYLLTKNTGIFVNTENLHYGYANGDNNCLFQTLIFSPSLFVTSKALCEKYMVPFADECSAILLTPMIAWQNKILSLQQALHTLCLQKEPGFELIVQNQILSMWTIIFENYKSGETASFMNCASANALKEMLQYIQVHSSEAITLQDIADSGSMCKSSCCKLFQTFLKTTPISYLNCCRLEKACFLLKDTKDSITQIAFSCGFSGTSYFTAYFHRKTGKTPSEYRKS